MAHRFTSYPGPAPQNLETFSTPPPKAWDLHSPPRASHPKPRDLQSPPPQCLRPSGPSPTPGTSSQPPQSLGLRCPTHPPTRLTSLALLNDPEAVLVGCFLQALPRPPSRAQGGKGCRQGAGPTDRGGARDNQVGREGAGRINGRKGTTPGFLEWEWKAGMERNCWNVNGNVTVPDLK